MPVATRSTENQGKIGFRARKSRLSVPAKIKDIDELKENKCWSENRARVSSSGLGQNQDQEISTTDARSKSRSRCQTSSPLYKENVVSASPLREKSQGLTKEGLSPRKRLFHDDNNGSSDKENTISDDKQAGLCFEASPSKQKRCDSQLEMQYKEERMKNKEEMKTSRCKIVLSKQESKHYGVIRQQLHTSIPERMLCREKEMNVICNFMEKKLGGKSSGSLYVSGAPGTGKTVCLNKVLQSMRAKKLAFREVWVNCMSLNQTANIYQKIASEVSGEVLKCKESEKYLEKYFQSSGPKIVLILDEIDQLESKNQEILYKIFEWPSLPKSRLVLVGIANALDLTDRILPRLQSKVKCRPELLQFPPYNKDQIMEILNERLKDVNDGLVDKNTVQFCARKVSAVAGDMRKALDIMRRSVELVELEAKRQQVLKAVTNSPSKDSTCKSPVQQKVTLSHVAKVVSEVYGSNFSNGNSSKESLPLQQKVLICTLLVLLKKEKAKEVTLPKLHTSYCQVCQQRQLSSVGQEEFTSLCQLVEARGIISVKQGKNMKVTKVSLRLQEADVDHALQDRTLLSSILEQGLQKM